MNKIGIKFGMSYLFLDPEYIGKVDFWSMFVFGLGTGGIIMSFNISSYIINARRFPFLATLAKPFYKFSINNCIVPLAFIIVYLMNFIPFQIENEFKNTSDILLKVAGFLSGIIAIIALTIIYFTSTNKEIYHYGAHHATHPSIRSNFVDDKLEEDFKNNQKKVRVKWRVETYLSGFSQIRLVRGTEHYDTDTLAKVFKQNHRNAFIFELVTILILFSIGLFKDIPFFMIPAGASVLLIFSILIMLGSAARFWLKGWTIPLVLLIFLAISFLSSKKVFEHPNCAYGLNYKGIPAAYDVTDLDYLQHKYNDLDIQSTLAILEKWKDRNTVPGGDKPKMVFIDVSGGGLRSALWTFHTLSAADSVMEGTLMKHTMVISGASGGMIGASYYRELYYRHLYSPLKSFQKTFYEDKISKDLLNPIAFSIIINDLLINVERFKDGNNEYSKDRAYAFESQLNINTDHLLEGRLKDYVKPEANAEIPMMIFSPTIEEDGRRLLISAQNISYLITTNLHNRLTFQPLPDAVEYTRLLKDHDPMNTRFTSIIRMNATFPYILPNVTLPTYPVMDVMDAGLRDNFGLKTSIKFLYVFRDWIAKNTSGVVFLQIRDTYKQSPMDSTLEHGILHALFTPVGSVYNNYMKTQDYNTDESMQFTASWFNNKVDWLIFQLPYSKEQVSMNWHLTSKEKSIITNSSIYLENQLALRKFRELMMKENY